MIPTDHSARSKKVLEFQRRLDEIKIDVITYGSPMHDDLTVNTQYPFFVRKYMKSKEIFLLANNELRN